MSIVDVIWCVVPFLVFYTVVMLIERRHKKNVIPPSVETNGVIGTLAEATQKMYERTYGKPCKELSTNFPDVPRDPVGFKVQK